MSEQVSWKIEGMSCQGCVRSVQAVVSKALGLDKAQVEVALEAATATFEAPEGCDLAALQDALKAKGFVVVASPS
jgi:copper chaperone CopZ